jgi:hypothetical protein
MRRDKAEGNTDLLSQETKEKILLAINQHHKSLKKEQNRE